MINFLDSAYSDSTPLEHKCYALEAVTHYRGLAGSGWHDVEKKIIIYLGSPQRRFEGLLLLKTAVDQCTAETFQKNALDWATVILKIFKNPPGDTLESRQLAYKVLRQIFLNTQKLPALKSAFASTFLPGLLDLLLQTSIADQWIEQAVECLAAAMKCFPASSGTKRDKIEEFLILLLDNWELKVFEPIAECFTCLPACGIEGNFTNAWSNQLKNFISILNAVLNFLYDGVENGIGELILLTGKKLPPVPDDRLATALKLVHRFKTYGLCLSKMLVSASRSEVAIPIDTLITLIIRTLSVSPLQMETDLAVLSFLPTLYLTILTILESFILSCEAYLVSHSHNIFKIIVQAVKLSFQNPNGSFDSLNKVRSAAYQVLQIYLKKCTLCLSDLHRGNLVAVMIEDIKPSAVEVKLTNLKGVRSAVTNCASGDVNSLHHSCIRTSTEALKAFQAIVQQGNLDQKSLQEIYSCVVHTILEVQLKQIDLPVPYSGESYRMALYSLFSSISRNLHMLKFTCLPTTISLVTNGLEDTSSMVASVCEEILDGINITLNSLKTIPAINAPCVEASADVPEFNIESVMSKSCNVYNNMTFETTPSMVNGVLPADTVLEHSITSQNGNGQFVEELDDEDQSTLRVTNVFSARENGGSSSSRNPIEDEGTEMEIGVEDDDEEEEEEEDYDDDEEEEEEEYEDEQLKEPYANHNGFSSDESSLEENEANATAFFTPSSAQNNELLASKHMQNDTQDHHSEGEINTMLEDFNPASPDS